MQLKHSPPPGCSKVSGSSQSGIDAGFGSICIIWGKKTNKDRPPLRSREVGSTIKGRGRCRGGLGCTEYMVTRRGSRQPAFRVNSLRIPCILSPPHIVMFASTTSACLLAPVALHALFARRRLSGQAGGQRLSSPRPSSSPWAYSGGWCSTHAPALNDDNGDAN